MNLERRKDESGGNRGGRMSAIRPHRTLPPLWRLHGPPDGGQSFKTVEHLRRAEVAAQNWRNPGLTAPHFGHLMTQAPRLKGLEQITHFVKHGADFLLIIHKSVRPKIWNGIVVLADISQHAQQPRQPGAVRLPELPAIGGYEQ